MERLFFQAPARRRTPASRPNSWIPPVEIVEEDDQFVVRAEMAGLGRDDISVEVADGVLTIRGELQPKQDEPDGSVLRRELRYGEFRRSLSLSDEVDAEGGSGSYENGILELHLPKRAGAKPRKIEIA